MPTYVDPDLMVHPLRLELDDDSVRDFIVRAHNNDKTLTVDECDAALDWMFDYVANERQTVYGVTTLQ